MFKGPDRAYRVHDTCLNVALPKKKKILRCFSLICRRSRSRMSLKIYAPLLTFATKHGRYLRKVDKKGIGTLSFVRASSELVMNELCRATHIITSQSQKFFGPK